MSFVGSSLFGGKDVGYCAALIHMFARLRSQVKVVHDIIDWEQQLLGS